MSNFDENKGGNDDYIDTYDEEEDENEYENEPVHNEEYASRNDEYADELHNVSRTMIEVEEVVGIGSGETTTEICIPLCPPAFEVMKTSIGKTIVFDAVVAGNNKVFINARLIKDIPFKTKLEAIHPGCERISKLTFGDIKHATAEIPVALCINVPGAKKGDKAVVLKYEVESVEILNHLRCAPNSCVGICEPSALRLDNCQQRLIRSITEKDCITITVKVVKPVIIPVPKNI